MVPFLRTAHDVGPALINVTNFAHDAFILKNQLPTSLDRKNLRGSFFVVEVSSDLMLIPWCAVSADPIMDVKGLPPKKEGATPHAGGAAAASGGGGGGGGQKGPKPARPNPKPGSHGKGGGAVKSAVLAGGPGANLPAAAAVPISSALPKTEIGRCITHSLAH